MKKLLFYSLLIIIYIFFSNKFAFSDSYSLRGKFDCGTWIESRSPNVNGTAYESFAQGVLNGMIIESKFDFWLKPYPITPKQSFLWIDKYCRENPLENVYSGIQKLFDQRKSDTN